MKSRGRLEVVCGSMFSGKSEELMRRLRRAEYAKKKVLTIKHKIDNRTSYSCIVSHDGESREAYPISSCEEGLAALLDMVDSSIDVIGIDEIQFFPEGTVPIIQQFIDMGKCVIVAGLDTDFRGDPFGIIPSLMAISDNVLKLHAICMVCGDEANHTQRLVNGEPARYDDNTILVGGEECYEARCR
ncbi:MAG: Thymidine kinase, partial [Chlamydiae bacterium]|nr:Thymidine kinase [Chlamydiota bacterium]